MEKGFYWVWVIENEIGSYKSSGLRWTEAEMDLGTQMRSKFPSFEPVAAFEHCGDAVRYARELNLIVAE